MSNQLADRFCSHCGVSLIPLEVPHSSAICATCGRTKYFVRPGEGGKGIAIEAGETFTIPAQWLTVSFDPFKGRGRLTRAGVPFLLKQLFTAGLPGTQQEFVSKLAQARDAWEKELQSSDKLAGINLSSPGGADEAFERLQKDHPDSWEWVMILKDFYTVMAVNAVEQNDALKAAHFALHAGVTHGLSVVTEPYFEEMAWRGYLAGVAIHESSQVAEHVPGELEALELLDPLFRRIGEANLQTWIDSNSAIGPKINVKSLPENVLLARAKWHLESLKREREESARRPAEARARSELRIKWLTLLGSLFGSALVGGYLAKLLT
jgi:hypothetical protein